MTKRVNPRNIIGHIRHFPIFLAYENVKEKDLNKYIVFKDDRRGLKLFKVLYTHQSSEKYKFF